LAKEGFNLLFIVRKDGIKEAKRVVPPSNKYGVQVEFISGESYFGMTGITEESLREKDLGIVVTGLILDGHHSDKTAKEQQDLLSLSMSLQLLLSGVILPRLLTHHETTGKRGALIHVLSSNTVHSSPERSPHYQQQHHLYSAWSRGFSFTFGLGLTEQFKDHLDILTAVRPSDKPNYLVPDERLAEETQLPQLRMASSTLEKSEYQAKDGEKVELSKLTAEKDIAEEQERERLEQERLRQAICEEEDHFAREFEYVPLQIMYQQLQQGKGSGGPHIGVWPFTKDFKPAASHGSR
jgi:hypothetical protein